MLKFFGSHVAGRVSLVALSATLLVLLMRPQPVAAANFGIQLVGGEACGGYMSDVTAGSCDTGLYPFDEHNHPGVFARMFVSANLATGALQLYGLNTPTLNAWFFDRLTFHLPNDLPVATIGFQLHVDGTNSTDWDNSVVINNSQFGAGMIVQHNGITSDQITQGWFWPGNGEQKDPGPPAIFDFTLFHELTVADGNFVDLNAYLSGSSLTGGVLDASNTGAFSLILPEGVTFTSASGVFLSQSEDPSSVPEPSTLLLSALGLAVFAIRMNSQSAR